MCVRHYHLFIIRHTHTSSVLAYIIKFANVLRVYDCTCDWVRERVCVRAYKFFLCGHCAIRKSRDLYALIKVPVYYPIDLSRAQKANNNNSKDCRVKSGFSLMFRFRDVYTHMPWCLACLHLALVFARLLDTLLKPNKCAMKHRLFGWGGRQRSRKTQLFHVLSNPEQEFTESVKTVVAALIDVLTELLLLLLYMHAQTVRDLSVQWKKIKIKMK